MVCHKQVCTQGHNSMMHGYSSRNVSMWQLMSRWNKLTLEVLVVHRCWHSGSLQGLSQE